jgi:hypothetical protein
MSSRTSSPTSRRHWAGADLTTSRHHHQRPLADVELVDFLDAPLAENTDRGIAPSLTACGAMLSELLTDPRVRAFTVSDKALVPIGLIAPRVRAKTR